MKGNTKSRLRTAKLHAVYHKSCTASTVMAASAACFVLGWLRGALMPALPRQGATVMSTVISSTADNGTQVGGAQGGARALREEEVQNITLPVFPPYAHGETGQAQVEHVQFQQLSWKPRAYLFYNFADPEKCDSIIAVAKRSMYPSGLALRAGEKPEDQKDVRTSTGTFVTGSMDPALAWVEQKMARVTGVPVEQGEAFNVLRYVHGQQYQAHMDTFDPKDFGPQPTNRIASFLLYLSDVEEGGETVFPHEDGVQRTERFDECVGLKVKPKKGDALLFWSMTPDHKIDPNSLHASCPLVKGEKWVATKWIRDG